MLNTKKNKKNIAFIFKTNEKIGGGHFWRCLNFSKILKKNNNNIFFISNILNHSYLKVLSKEKIKSIQIRQLNDFKKLKQIIIGNKINILVIDYYNFNYDNKKKIKKILEKLIIIDDHINKKHFCDIFINNNFLEKDSINKIKKLNPDTSLLLGSKYFIFNENLNNKENRNLKKNKKVKRIFLFFGSSDNSNLTLRVLRFLKKFKKLKLDVIVGNMNKNSYKINNYCKNLLNIKLYNSLSNDKIFTIMSKNDLGIGAGGVNLYERLFMGLPSIVITNANNQLKSNKYLYKKNIIEYLGKDKNLTKEKFEKSLNKVLDLKKYKSLLNKTNSFFYSKRKKNFLSNKINKLLNLNSD